MTEQPAARVNLDDVVIALEGGDGQTWFIDREKGELILTSEELDEDDMELPVPLEDMYDHPRFVQVEPLESSEGYDIMAAFLETVRDAGLRRRLEDALDGKGAFGRFKRVLQSVPPERERWFAFKDEKLKARARRFLEDEGIPYEERQR